MIPQQLKRFWIRFMSTAIFVVSLSGGCSPDIEIELYNNTGSLLSIIGCKQSLSVPPGKKAELGSVYLCSEWLMFKSQDLSWRYRLWTPSHNVGETGHYYYQDHRWNLFHARLTILLQINPDHRVFVLPEGMDFPVDENLPQPRGFPWIPQSLNVG